MTAEVLVAACRLAFDVARHDVESGHPAEPPAAMRSFLQVDDLPRRAIAVACQAIEDHPDFRQRVAMRADEGDVGRAGYLWLHRPDGWALEFERLTGVDVAGADLDTNPDPDPDYAFDPGETFSPASPPIADASMVTVSPLHGSPDRPPRPPTPSVDPASLGRAAMTDHAEYQTADDQGYAPVDAAGRSMVAASERDFEADALESELSSLRGLVDRLAGERELVLAATPELGPEEDEFEHQAPPRYVDDDLQSLRSDLETAQHELSIAQSELAIARQEREEAQRLHSETLKRQVQLEKELAGVREQRVTVENQASDTQVVVINLEERLKRTDSQLQEADRERKVIRSQLETMTLERNQIREERAALRGERDELQARVAEVEEKTGGVDIGELTAANRALSGELETTNHELARMIGQAEHYQEQLRSVGASADTLKAEKIDLRSRLADAELAVETTRTQHEALKVDGERMAAEVGTLRAERDGLQSQLTELQVSLSDVLAEQADIRKRNDDDRRALNELRVERDVLLARMVDLEQAEHDGNARVEALSAERDELLAARDELIDERGQLRGEAAAGSAERTKLLEKLGAAESRIGPLETELQAERRQREELANRLLELDDLAERNAAELAAVLEERQTMVVALDELRTERIEVGEIQIERDGLAAELAESERRYDEETSRLRERLSEVTELVGDLETAHSGLERQLAEARSELEVKRAEFEETKREATRLSVITETSAGELEEVRGLLESREAELEQIRQARISALDDADEARIALDLKASELQVAADARAKAETHIEELQAKLVATSSTLQGDLDGVNEELETTRAELQAARAELETARLDAEAQTAAVETAKADAETAKADAEAQAAELAGAKLEVEGLRAEVRSTADELELKNDEVERGSRALEAVSQQLEEATAELDTARTELETARADLQTARTELDTANADLDTANADLETTRTDLETTNTELTAKRSELDARSDELHAATSELAAKAFELDEKSSELERTNRELEATSSQLSAANSDLSDTTANLQATTDELAARSAELDETNARLASDPSEGAMHRAPVAPVDDRPADGSDDGFEPSVADDEDIDELDAMAAEVRDALERSSVLDTLSGRTTPTEEVVVDDEVEPVEEPDVSVGPEAPSGFGLAVGDRDGVDEGLVGRGTVEPSDDAYAWPRQAGDEPVDDRAEPWADEPDERSDPTDDTAELETSPGAELIDGPERSPIEAETAFDDEPSGPASGAVVGAIGVTADVAPDDDDEEDLDTISELIARTVSSFGADGGPSWESGQPEIDLTGVESPTAGGFDNDGYLGGSAPPSIIGQRNDGRPAERPDLGLRRAGGTNRRQIDVPGDILDDEVAVARFVVSSPDVVLLVDGDSVAKLGWPSLPVAQQRDALVTYLADLSASSGAAPDVVFDGRIGDDDSLPASRAVRIRLSTPPTEPTAALDELVDAYPDQWPIALVTDDLDLAGSAADRGAAVLNNGQLLDLFIAQ